MDYAAILAEICGDDGDCTSYALAHPEEAKAANFSSESRANYKFNFERPYDTFPLDQQLGIDEVKMDDDAHVPLQFNDRTLSMLEAYFETFPMRLRGELDPVVLDYFLEAEKLVRYDPDALVEIELLRRTYSTMRDEFQRKLDSANNAIAEIQRTIQTNDGLIIQLAKENHDLERQIAASIEQLKNQRDVNRRAVELQKIGALERELQQVDARLKDLRQSTRVDRDKATRYVALRDRVISDFSDYEQRVIDNFRKNLSKRVTGRKVATAVNRIEQKEIEPTGAASSSTRAFGQLRRNIFDTIINPSGNTSG